MRKIILSMFMLMFTVWVNAQINNPVKWTHTAVKTAGKTYELRLTASIDDNWHMYAQETGDGPEPTTISFINNPLVIFDGKPKEVGKLVTVYEKYFRSESKYYEKRVDFVQKIKVKSSIATLVKGNVIYVACNDKGKCLAPKDFPFSIAINGK